MLQVNSPKLKHTQSEDIGKQLYAGRGKALSRVAGFWAQVSCSMLCPYKKGLCKYPGNLLLPLAYHDIIASAQKVN